MKVDTYLEQYGGSRSDIAKRLGVSRQAVSKWDEIPEKWFNQLTALIGEQHREVMEKDIVDRAEYADKTVGVVKGKIDTIYGKTKHGLTWFVRDDKVTWLGSEFGHGSEWDYNYSAAKIFHIRRLLEQMGTIQGVFDFCGGIFEKSFIQDVSKNSVCPNIPGFEGFKE